MSQGLSLFIADPSRSYIPVVKLNRPRFQKTVFRRTSLFACRLNVDSLLNLNALAFGAFLILRMRGSIVFVVLDAYRDVFQMLCTHARVFSFLSGLTLFFVH